MMRTVRRAVTVKEDMMLLQATTECSRAHALLHPCRPLKMDRINLDANASSSLVDHFVQRGAHGGATVWNRRAHPRPTFRTLVLRQHDCQTVAQLHWTKLTTSKARGGLIRNKESGLTTWRRHLLELQLRSPPSEIQWLPPARCLWQPGDGTSSVVVMCS